MDRQTELIQRLAEIVETQPVRFVFSNGKGTPLRRAVISRKRSGTREFWQEERYTQTQVFHQNWDPACELTEELLRCFDEGFRQMDAFSAKADLRLRITKKGDVRVTRSKPSQPAAETTVGHNRTKRYLLQEGEPIPPLVDMGVFTADGKVVHAMYDKFRQINRFLEQVEDILPEMQAPDSREYSVIDFGCGKSYLTFILYYYLTQVRRFRVRMLGLDLKEDVIRNCEQTARRYAYEGLHFEVGDIGGYRTEAPVDLVVTLHACDTATDFALANAVGWKAEAILSVPCCQHELNGQIRSERLSALTHFGILQERAAALMTDAIRADLLIWSGYRTQVLEFVDFAHTPKNLLIRAVRARLPEKQREEARREAQRLMEEFHLDPTLYRLLCGDREAAPCGPGTGAGNAE